MINIKVNSKDHQFQSSNSLEVILKALDISVNGIAVAVYQDIISKSDWNLKTLNEGDEVLIIKATQGG